jgi:uncharacterized protein (DUF58 family)
LNPFTLIRSRLALAWRRRTRWRLSKEGRLFAVLTMGIAFAAFNTSSNLLFLLLSLLLSVLLLSGILAAVSLTGLSIRRLPPSTLFAGTETFIALRVLNRKRHFPSLSLTLREHFGRRSQLEAVDFEQLPPGQWREAGYRCVFPRRGRCRFRAICVESSFPFGLLARSQCIELPGLAIVFPRIDLPVDLHLQQAQGSGELGEKPAQGEDFWALRSYRSGDDRRLIAWKASARARQLLLRETASAGVSSVEILLANVCSSTHRDDDFEELIDLTASALMRLHEQDYAVGLSTLDQQIPPGRGDAHLERLLVCLALLRHFTPEQTEDVSFPSPLAEQRVFVAHPLAEPFRPPQVDAELQAGETQ